VVNPAVGDVAVLLSAIRRRDVAAVRALLDTESSLAGQRAASGETPALVAIYSRSPSILALLRERGAQLDVFEAAAAGDDQRLRELLDGDPRLVNGHAPDGWTPLHLAAHFRHESSVALLLERGADLRAAGRTGAGVPGVRGELSDVRLRSHNSNGNTPLHAAAAGGAGRALIKRLLDAGVEVDAPQSGGFTGLHEAAGTGNEGVLRLLLDAGAAAGAMTRGGKTPAMLAREAGHEAIARLLDAGGGAHA
jgi:ankyrin repeat protein